MKKPAEGFEGVEPWPSKSGMSTVGVVKVLLVRVQLWLIPQRVEVTPLKYPNSVGVTALDVSAFEPFKYGTVVAVVELKVGAAVKVEAPVNNCVPVTPRFPFIVRLPHWVAPNATTEVKSKPIKYFISKPLLSLNQKYVAGFVSYFSGGERVRLILDLPRRGYIQRVGHI